MKRFLFVLMAMFAFLTSFLNVSAADSVSVMVDGEELHGAVLRNSITYVPLKSFSSTMAESAATWNGEERIAGIESDGVSVSVPIGKGYIVGNGRYLAFSGESMIIDGSTYVPVRIIGKVFGADVSWDGKTRSVSVRSGGEPLASGDEFYKPEDVYWLSRIISSESRGEPMIGKIAVGNVVLNRVASDMFPDTVHGVIFDSKNGVQFTPAENGTVYNEPTEESVIAAKICLDDYKITDNNIMFFYNPAISKGEWMTANREYAFTIGNHKFFA